MKNSCFAIIPSIILHPAHHIFDRAKTISTKRAKYIDHSGVSAYSFEQPFAPDELIIWQAVRRRLTFEVAI